MKYADKSFHNLDADGSAFLEYALYAAKKIAQPRSALEIGCGSGEILERLLDRASFRKVTCIDLSEENASETRQRLAPHASEASIRVITGNWLESDFQPADLALAESVLHLLNAPFEEIAAKLEGNVRKGGFLLMSVPVKCWPNTVLVGVRRVLKKIECDFTKRLLSRGARLLYPKIEKNILAERVNYMFVIPGFAFGDREKSCLERHGFREVSRKKTKFYPGKPVHSIFLYEKIA